MATTVYGATWKGTYSSYTSYFRVHCTYNWEPNYSTTQARLTVTSVGIQRTSGNSAVEMVASAQKSATISLTGKTSVTYDKEGTSYSWAESNTSAKNFMSSNQVWLIDKTGSAQTLTFTASAKKNSGAWSGSSSKSVTLTVPAKSDQTITYDGVLTGATNIPAAQTKGSGYSVVLSSQKPVCAGYTFLGWSTTSGGALEYTAGATYPAESGTTTLYAVWYKAPSFANIRAYRTSGSSTPPTFPTVDSASTKGFCVMDYTEPYNASSVSATIKFGTASGSATIDGGYVYRYSADADCPITSRTQVLITITATDKAGTVHTYTASTYISAQAMGIDAFKTTTGSTANYVNLGFGVMASETAGSRQRIDADSDFYVFVDSNAASGIDYDLYSVLDSLGWWDNVNE